MSNESIKIKSRVRPAASAARTIFANQMKLEARMKLSEELTRQNEEHRRSTDADNAAHAKVLKNKAINKALV